MCVQAKQALKQAHEDNEKLRGGMDVHRHKHRHTHVLPAGMTLPVVPEHGPGVETSDLNESTVCTSNGVAGQNTLYLCRGLFMPQP